MHYITVLFATSQQTRGRIDVRISTAYGTATGSHRTRWVGFLPATCCSRTRLPREPTACAVLLSSFRISCRARIFESRPRSKNIASDVSLPVELSSTSAPTCLLASAEGSRRVERVVCAAVDRRRDHISHMSGDTLFYYNLYVCVILKNVHVVCMMLSHTRTTALIVKVSLPWR